MAWAISWVAWAFRMRAQALPRLTAAFLFFLGAGAMVYAGSKIAGLKDTAARSEGVASQALYDVGRRLIKDVEAVIRSSMEEAKSIAAQPDVIQILKVQSPEIAKEFCNRELLRSQHVDALLLFDSTGDILAINTHYRSGDPISPERLEKVAAAEFKDRSVISTCLENKTEREALEFQTHCDVTPALFDSSGLSVAYSVPVYEPATKELLGLLSIRLDFATVSQVLHDNMLLFPQGNAFFVSDTGHIFDEDINSGRTPSPLQPEFLSSVVKPLGEASGMHSIFKRKDQYYAVMGINNLSTLVDGGLHVVVSVSKARIAAMVWKEQVLLAIIPASIGLVLVALSCILVLQVNLQRRKAETQLETQRLASVFMAVADGILLADCQGRITAANPAAERIFGRSAEDLVGRFTHSAWCGAIDEQGQSLVSTCQPILVTLQSKQPVRSMVYGIRAGDDSRRWISVSTEPVTDRHGELSFVVMSVSDVTQIREQATRLKALVNGAGIGTWDWHIPSGHVQFNDHWVNMLGYTLNEIEPHYTSWAKLLDPDQAAKVLSHLQNYLNGEVPDYKLELKLFRKDGSIADVLTSGNVIERDANGKPVRLAGVHVDISESKKLEAEIKAVSDRYEVAIAGTSDGLWDWNTLTDEVWFSQRFWTLLGFPEQGPFPPSHISSWRERLHPDDLESTLNALAECHQWGKEYDVQYRMHTMDGNYRWFRARAATQFNESGKPFRMAGSIQDISEQRWAQDSLTSLQEQLRLFVEHTPAAVAMLDRNMCYLVTSRSWYEQYQLHQSDITGMSHYEVFPQISDEWKELHQRALQGETFAAEQDCMALANGRPHWIRWELRPWYDAEGNVGGVIMFTQEINDQIENERVLREAKVTAETALREVTALRSALDEHALLSIADSKGKIIDANSGFCRISGYTREELLGQDHRILNSGTHPKSFWKDVWRMIRSGKAWRGEVCNRRKDGTLYWVDSTIVPYRGSEGNIEKYVSIRFDITAQKTAEEAIRNERSLLAESEQRFRTLVNNIPGASFRCKPDSHWTMLFMSDAIENITGYLSADFLENKVLSFDSLIHEEDRQWVRQYAEDAVAKRVSYSVEYRIVHRDGSVRWVSETGRGVYSDEVTTDPIFLDGAIFDVTERRQRENDFAELRRAAEAANAAKSEFLANMSHEIRTPMTAILGYTDLLAEESGNGTATTQRNDNIETIRRNGEHLLAIINDILDISKIEAGKMTVEQIPVSTAQILSDIENLMKVKVAGKGIQFQIVQETPLPQTIFSDPVRLRQILVNLVGNAIKFTELGDVAVRVSLDQPDSSAPKLRFKVCDTGIGLSPEQLQRLFSAFSQADCSTTRRFGGSGLGLLISKRLAEILGGDISVESTLGQGSQFTLTIATGSLQDVCILSDVRANGNSDANADGLANEVASRMNRSVQKAEAMQTSFSGLNVAATPLAGMKIFLAEDGPDNQRLISHHLRKAGAEVEVFENGLLCLQALTEDGSVDGPLRAVPPCDLVLTDMQMPEMDGYTLARALRSKGWYRRIIALTAHAMSGDEQKCLDAGCDAYATKPIDRNSLIRTCATSLELIQQV